MSSWADVARVALDLPGAVQDDSGSTTAWRVGSRAFAWERLLRPGELRLPGASARSGPALGVRVPDGAARAAWLAEYPQVFFLVPHYEPFLMVLLFVQPSPVEVLDEAVTESWLDRAPKRPSAPWLAAAGLPVDR